ncbi:hypothetical protein [Nocardia sp. NPDC059239]|uniref:hypothetical protein n=1 Tax=Nocardia sp. NPDC059239 TaxID=3346785 RepID=UPI00367DBDD9
MARCRERCWRKDWVIDLDVAKFFDSVPWDLMVKAVAVNITTEQRWVLLYVKRWLAAPIQQPDGTLVERDRGTPQGSAATPPTQLAMFALLVGAGGRGIAVGAFADGDAVADSDLFRSDEDIFDQQLQYAPAFVDGRGFCVGVQLREESLQVRGEGEVGVAVGELSVERIDLVA